MRASRLAALLLCLKGDPEVEVSLHAPGGRRLVGPWPFEGVGMEGDVAVVRGMERCGLREGGEVDPLPRDADS